MNSFGFHFPTRLVFGNGTFETLGDEASRLGRRALLVTYAGEPLADLTARALKLLQASGVSVVVYAEAIANPTHELIDRGGELARQENCDLVIGLGGGSALDTGKGIAVTARQQTGIWQIFEGAPITQPPLPLIAVPTTAGTGSEATFFAVVSHRELHRKEGFARPQFFPTLSLIDPLLTLSLPPAITAATGMDALSHAIEAYYCKMATPLVDATAEQAIRLAGRYLRRAVFDGKDVTARYNMMLANTLAGMALTQSDSCLAHVIGEAVGAVYNTGHGVSVAACLPATMEFNCMANAEKFAAITRLLGEDGDCLTEREAARKAPAVVRDLLVDIGLPMGLAQLGVSELGEVLALVNRPGMDASSPRSAGAEDFQILAQACMAPAMSYWEAGGR